MLQTITFKTELSDILTLEEVAVLFDSIKKKTESELVSLSLFPKFNQLRERIILKATIQRNAELSQLLMRIAERKQELKINIWRVLSAIGAHKKKIQKDPSIKDEFEQIIYEEQQIIKTYESSIKMLERKEKKIMNGKYSHVDKIKSLTKKKILKKQLFELRERLQEISERHDDCFSEYLYQIDDLVEGSTINQFPKNQKNIYKDSGINCQTISIDETYDTQEQIMHYERKHGWNDYYVYEPDESNMDDELIFQLLAQGKYDDKGGTINCLLMSTETEEV